MSLLNSTGCVEICKVLSRKFLIFMENVMFEINGQCQAEKKKKN